MDVPDSELMSRLAAGEDLALNALMNRWSDRIVAFLYRMTGQRETAVDLAQETFVRLYQARSRYRPGGQFSTYVFAIAANLARNHARWKSRHPTVSLDAEETTGEGLWWVPEDPGPSPGEVVIAREKSAALHQALLALPLDLREALSLLVYEQMSYAEIAELARCTPKAVETRVYRARQILKEQLKELR